MYKVNSTSINLNDIVYNKRISLYPYMYMIRWQDIVKQTIENRGTVDVMKNRRIAIFITMTMVSSFVFVKQTLNGTVFLIFNQFLIIYQLLLYTQSSVKYNNVYLRKVYIHIHDTQLYYPPACLFWNKTKGNNT